MIFNSIDFAVFLPIVFAIYWFVLNKKIRAQNLFLLVSSYVFYGWWDWHFLFLIIFSSFLDYFLGLRMNIDKDIKRRKYYLGLSVFFNIGFLAYFKYFNFFIDSFSEAFTFFGSHIEPSRLNIILPVGISFYTFQTLSYSIDVYRRKLEPTRDMISFFAFVSFFPQLVAGPIERATHLLPQFYNKRAFNYNKAVDGLRQILWGLFKKVVIADNCALLVNDVFQNYDHYNGSTLFLGSVFFAFQIYGDFSGYSDIAIGTSRLFGFNLKQNFAFPYFSRDIAEFWRRWHISLSTWFRDYLYFPLGGSRGNIFLKIRNTFIIFLVSGFWHGANWTFVCWGAINALYFLPLLITKRNRINTNVVAEGKYLMSIRELAQMGFTFFITCLAWVFFRADTIQQAFHYISRIFSWSFFETPNPVPNNVLLLLLAFFIVIEWMQRDKKHALELKTEKIIKPLRWLFYLFLIFLMIAFSGESQEFIYFQF
jgi:alginate O-acetyltransferase complex protein AlgI